MAHQSLYRRYRSQKFSEIVGQGHVTSALRTAVAEGRHGHAYLFSGPRGTGKTSTARILAKALNCPDVAGGEPCGVCESCQAIEQGSSFDLHELDAASHNKVDDIRDLISKVHLGSPGRTKVYILDEVHMLSSGAENALLKTLEEPPDHVVFVLATTEPHKVVPTIRSRTQHFEFHLLPADELAEHVRYVVADAGLDVDDHAIEYVLAQGGGSARDTLSALDLVTAAGGVPAGSDVGVELTTAIGAGDPAAAIAAVQHGLTAGQEPRTIGEATVEVLRNAFLAAMGADLHHLNDRAADVATELGRQLGPATVTRSLEAIGQALVEMRQAPDPRVPLEVAVLRLSRGATPTPTGGDGGTTPTDGDAQALAARVAELEQQVRDLTARLDAGATAGSVRADGRATAPAAPTTAAGSGPADAATVVDDGPASGSTPSESTPSGPAAAARNRLAEATAKAPPSPRANRAAAATDAATPTADDHGDATGTANGKDASTGAGPANGSNEAGESDAPAPATPTADAEPDPADPAQPGDDGAATGRPALSSALTQAAVESALPACLEEVSQKTRVRFRGGRILGVEGATVIFGVPNEIHRSRCVDQKGEVERTLGQHFGQAVTVEIRVDGDAPAPTMDPAKIEPAQRPAADADEDIGPVEELADATDQSATGVDRLTKAFPGSTVIEQTGDADQGSR